MEEKIFAIEQGLAQAILNYLSQKPWVEVNRLIELLKNMKEVKAPENEKEEAKK